MRDEIREVGSDAELHVNGQVRLSFRGERNTRHDGDTHTGKSVKTQDSWEIFDGSDVGQAILGRRREV